MILFSENYLRTYFLLVKILIEETRAKLYFLIYLFISSLKIPLDYIIVPEKVAYRIDRLKEIIEKSLIQGSIEQKKLVAMLSKKCLQNGFHLEIFIALYQLMREKKIVLRKEYFLRVIAYLGEGLGPEYELNCSELCFQLTPKKTG